MQVYQSIELELQTQKSYIIMFLICISCGYAVSVTRTWQYYMIAAICVVSIGVNFLVEYNSSQK